MWLIKTCHERYSNWHHIWLNVIYTLTIKQKHISLKEQNLVYLQVCSMDDKINYRPRIHRKSNAYICLIMPIVKLYIWSWTFKMFNTSLLLSVGIECTRTRSYTHNHTVLPDHTHIETLCVFSFNTAIKPLECNCPVRLMPLKIAPGHTVRHIYKKETIKFDNSKSHLWSLWLHQLGKHYSLSHHRHLYNTSPSIYITNSGSHKVNSIWVSTSTWCSIKDKWSHPASKGWSGWHQH